ncbi:MAG: hypothetical protein A3I14_17265 [Candidatus Rokubacteria bacterium RIFCSPLOWO2_02_FULL_73_56]|nr:MAG: hypothetical protein A3I14_17265 [Candidatus Rokubacteria bacterium RIFCSPLOWO2_02_FULL_73_56]
MQHHALRAAGVVDAEAPLAERLDPRRERPRRPGERGAHPGAREHGLAARVERHQVERQARRQHAVRRLGVHVEVELGRRRDVPGHVHRAAHRDHAPDERQRAGVGLERERQVRERAEGDDGEEPLQAPGRLDDQLDRVRQDRRPLGLRPVREVRETVLAVVAGRGHERAGERARRALADGGRRVGPAQREQPEEVRGRGGDGDVARDGGDRLHAELGGTPREQQGERIVDARVRVDQDGDQGISRHPAGIIL